MNHREENRDDLLLIEQPMKWIGGRRSVVDHAREIADLGDRWFLSVTGGIAYVGGWARREAEIVAESAVAAFATSVTVAKRLSFVGPPPRARLRSQPAPRLDDVSRLEGEEGSEPSWSRGFAVDVDLISAVRAADAPSSVSKEGGEECRLGVSRDPLARSAPPGVVPLLQALGRTVARHTHAGYASLQEDPRFWTLVHLLQRLGRPTITSEMDETGRASRVPGPVVSKCTDLAAADIQPQILSEREP
jgi:hypothetical protein